MNNNFFYNAYIYFIKLKYNSINVEFRNFNLNNNDNNDNFYTLLKNEYYQIIGIYDKRTKIWLNAWALINYDNNIEQNLNKIKELLKYILNFEKDMKSITNQFEKTLIKSILINPKIYIYEYKTQLDIVLSIICYLLKAKSIFYKLNNDIIVYIIKI